MEKYLSPAEVASLLGISRKRAYRLVAGLPHLHIGRLVRVAERDLKAFIAQNSKPGWFASASADKEGEQALPGWARPLRVRRRGSPKRST